MGAKPRWGAYVTAFQISQMFLGIFIVASAAGYQASGQHCDVTRENITAAMAMYASYAALFCWSVHWRTGIARPHVPRVSLPEPGTAERTDHPPYSISYHRLQVRVQPLLRPRAQGRVQQG